MKIEDCIIAIERRTAGGCLELGIAFLRRFAWPVTRLTLWYAVPSCLIVWYLQSQTTDALFWAIPLFATFQALWSAALVAAIGPQVFGVPMSPGKATRAVLRRSILYLFLTGFFRLLQLLLSMAMLFPGLIANVLIESWSGHLAEVMFLENTSANRVTSRLSWLCGGGGYGRNFGRLMMLWSFALVLIPAVMVTLDGLMWLLTSNTVWIGPLIDALSGLDQEQKFWSLISDEPGFLLMTQVSLWLSMPVLRIAWFVCYLDQRIRNECWDLDLQFRMEAIRLEHAA
ncbi:MAG: hypothetical protein KDA85_07710 [Planctomycetaceae bacterium]|nr:hypothetical protein [Planctomycetaceae bacterium]